MRRGGIQQLRVGLLFDDLKAVVAKNGLSLCKAFILKTDVAGFQHRAQNVQKALHPRTDYNVVRRTDHISFLRNIYFYYSSII